MNKRSNTRNVVGIAAGVAVAAGILLAPAAASAHVGLQPDGAPTAGSTRDLTFAFGHGCDGSATKSITIDLPTEGIAGAQPVVQSGWTIDIAKDGDAGRPSAVTFTADEAVPDELRAEVALNVGLLEDASGTIAFPVTQVCEEGELVWDQVAEEGEDPHALESPAPTLEVVPAAEDASEDAHGGHGAGATGEEGDALPVVLGGAGLLAGVAALVVSVVALRRRSA